jgi:imidazolonepropionase-like amidohydrolase
LCPIESKRRLASPHSKALRAGVPVVAGMDGLAGFTLHRELELYVQAGIPPVEVLRIATLGAATVMHRDNELGSVTPGKLADLVVIFAGGRETLPSVPPQ